METKTQEIEAPDRCNRCDRPLGMSFYHHSDGDMVHHGCKNLPKIEDPPDIVETRHEINLQKICVVEGCGQTISTPNDRCYIHFNDPVEDIETG